MSVEEELKKDHAEMQAAVDSKQKIIDAQVSAPCQRLLQFAGWVCQHTVPPAAVPAHGEAVWVSQHRAAGRARAAAAGHSDCHSCVQPWSVAQRPWGGSLGRDCAHNLVSERITSPGALLGVLHVPVMPGSSEPGHKEHTACPLPSQHVFSAFGL